MALMSILSISTVAAFHPKSLLGASGGVIVELDR